jgi:hypothetical protein
MHARDFAVQAVTVECPHKEAADSAQKHFKKARGALNSSFPAPWTIVVNCAPGGGTIILRLVVVRQGEGGKKLVVKHEDLEACILKPTLAEWVHVIVLCACIEVPRARQSSFWHLLYCDVAAGGAILEPDLPTTGEENSVIVVGRYQPPCVCTEQGCRHLLTSWLAWLPLLKNCSDFTVLWLSPHHKCCSIPARQDMRLLNGCLGGKWRGQTVPSEAFPDKITNCYLSCYAYQCFFH